MNTALSIEAVRKSTEIRILARCDKLACNHSARKHGSRFDNGIEPDELSRLDL